MIADRRAAAEKALSEAQAARDRAKLDLAGIDKTRAGFAAERETILNQAREDAGRESAAKLKEAGQKAEAQMAAAKAGVENDKAAATRAWATRSSDLAVDIAKRLAARLDGPAVQGVFLDWALKAVRALPETTRAAVAGSAVALVTTSATPLDAAQQTQATKMIGEAFGGPVRVVFKTDPRPDRGIGVANAPTLSSPTPGAPTSPEFSRTSRMTSDHDAASWLDAAHEKLAASALGAQAQEIGRVEQVGDGVALVSGLPHVRLAELLKFERGQFGFVQSLSEDRIGCVLLDDVDGVKAGDSVSGAGDVVRTPVGPELLGRVVDPLGRPLDGKGQIATRETMPIERPAPAIVDRDLVIEPVQTGLVVIDALFALGRGQRELIIGDRAIGKTTIGVDVIINQKLGDINCIYVAIGQKSSSVRRAIDDIFGGGARERCLVVVAEAASSPGLQWIAPFAAMTMAEYFRDRGQHALIVLDDLTKHAATHREIALLTRQSPGREAYPGDVFYVHARLLERASKLSKEKGGGSLTALPIAETDAGNLSAYIPTNLISITDGQNRARRQLVLSGPEARRGRRHKRQPRRRARRRRARCATAPRRCGLDYAQFLELETFTRFGGMSDARVKQQLTRGARIRAILGQPQHAPYRLADEVALVLAVQTGLLDPAPLAAAPTFLKGLHAALDLGAADVVASIEKDGVLGEADKVKLKAVLQTYVASCVAPAPK